MSDAFHSLFAGDESQLGGTHHGGEGIAYIGRRGLVVGLLLAVQLVVVGDEPVVLPGHKAVEEVPGVLRQLTHLGGLLFREVFLVLREFLAQPVHQEGGAHPGHTGEGGGDNGHDITAGQLAAVANHHVGHDGQHYRAHVVEPELAKVVAKGAFGALGGFVRGDPCQQVVMREPHAVAGADKGVGIHPCLFGQQGELDERTIDNHLEATHKGGVVVVAFAKGGQLGNLAQDEEYDGAGHHDEGRQQIPCRADVALRADAQSIAYKYHHHDRQAEDAPAQVVEYLPAPDGVDLVLDLLAFLVAHFVLQPADNLPVATRPAVVAFSVVDIIGGVVVEKLEVVDEAAADVAALDEVVTQDKVLGEGPFQHFLEHTEVVDALAAERALVEDVLVELEAGGGVDIQAAEAGEELREAALVGHLHIHVDAGLHDAVAGVDATSVIAEFGTVQRVGHGADEFLGRIEHQLGVGVEGDDELYVGHGPLAPMADGLAAETFLALGLGGLSQHEVVEVQDGSTLAFVAQPGLLALAPCAAAVDEVEDGGTVFLVQLFDFGEAGLDHLVVPRGVGLLVGGGVADEGVVEVLRTAFKTLESTVPAIRVGPCA